MRSLRRRPARRPAVRGAVHRWLSALGKSGDEQQKAASVAALISGSGRTAASALKLAEETLQYLPATDHI